MRIIPYEVYLDKVHGGWIGKCIGGACGARQEGNKSFMHYTKETLFPDVVPPNDDLDLQVLYLQEVLGKKGPHITSEDLAVAFAKYNLCICNEYAVAIKNIDGKIMPPYSGSYCNSYFSESMGCPIRSELWGYLCPGCPETAVRYAEMDGYIDHTETSVYGEQYLSAVAAMAFFESDIEKLLTNALVFIPDDCAVRSCVDYVMSLYKSGVKWQAAREKIVRSFGSVDSTYSVVNVAIIIMALLYGNMDFTETLLIAINSGYDTDCTAASACALIGQIIGARNIDQFWLDKISDKIVVGTVDIKKGPDSITELAANTCAAGLSFARDKVIDTQISDIPQGIRPSLPPSPARSDIELRVEYQGQPAVGKGFNAYVNAVVSNKGSREFSGSLRITPAKALVSDKTSVDIVLAPKETKKIPLCFSVNANAKTLPVKNVNCLTLNGKYTCEFGLAGAIGLKIIGPFFDTYDTKTFSEDPYNERQQRLGNRVDMYAIFNGFVDIDRAYIDESFNGIDELEGTLAEFSEEIISTDKYISFKGPYCVYAIYDFYCPQKDDKAAVLIGNNCEFKLWLNNEFVTSGGIDMYMPFNYSKMIRLNEGRNRMIIKLVRRNTDVKFSFILRDSHDRYRYSNSYSSILE